MNRLLYFILAGGLVFLPLMAVWASEPDRSTTTTRSGVSRPYGGGTYLFFGGGRGGWLSGSYNYGSGGGRSYSGGSSTYRGGGPGGGGK